MRLPGIWSMLALMVVAAGFLAPTAAPGQEARGQVIVVPAVSFSGEGGGEVSKNEPRQRGGEPDPGYVHFWYTPGHWLEWALDDIAAGEYEVTVRYAGKFDTARSLAANGRPAAGLERFTLPRTGRWSTWSETKLPAPVTLPAGRSVLRMTCLDDASVRIRDIVLSAPGKTAVTIKAASFTGQGGGRVQVLTPPTCGYVGKWGGEGHWLEWAVDAPAAGRYRVAMHYAADGYRRLELQVNGEKVEGLEDFIPPYTGDDRNWTVGTLPVPVTLKAGKNTLRLTTVGREQRGVPAFGGPFALSATQLEPLAAGASLGDNVLAVTTVAEVTRPKEEPKAMPTAPLGPPLAVVEGAVPLVEGGTFDLARGKVTIAKVDVVPYVENRFSKRFEFESYDNPELHRLREKYKLDEVIAPGRDEFEKQVLLMKWVWDQWDFGHAQELYYTIDPFLILDEAKREHKFQCMHSGAVLLTAANSLGWVARPMAIPRHTFTEIWSNQLRKWVMFDATSNYFPEKNGVPLNTYEQRQALLREGGGVMRARMGDQGMERKEQSTSYGQRLLFIGYIPNTDLLVRGPQYGNDKFFITKDELCEGRGWHTRDCPDDPATEPYFPINQAAMAIVPDGQGVKVTLGTMTPNFQEFQVRVDGRQWQPAETVFNWPVRAGENRLEARSVNRFGVPGPVSTVVLRVEK